MSRVHYANLVNIGQTRTSLNLEVVSDAFGSDDSTTAIGQDKKEMITPELALALKTEELETQEEVLKRSTYLKRVQKKVSEVEGSNVIAVFSTGLKGIRGIKTIGTSRAWVNIGNELVLVDDKGRQLVRQDIDQNSDDFDVVSTGEILVVEAVNRVIKSIRFSTLTYMKQFDITSPHIPMSLCVTKAGDIVVTLSKQKGCKCLRKYEVCFRRYTNTGECVFEKRLSHQGKIIFLVTSAIIQNKTDFCVVGKRNVRVNFLAVFNQNLDFRFEYRGTCDRQRKNIFNPEYICAHPNSNILISDPSNRVIDIIDKDGHFLMSLLTENDGITCLRGVSVDPEGKVWVAQEGGDIIIVESPEVS